MTYLRKDQQNNIVK